MTIDGNTLIAWGFKPGRWFNDAINDGNALLKQGWSEEAVREIIAERQPAEIQPRTNALPFNVFLDPETDDEAENLAGVVQHMDVLMRVPVVTAGAVMPDACPSGVASKGIHPGMHSADICCSMAVSVFRRDMDPSSVLDIAMKTTHFGYGRRSEGEKNTALTALLGEFATNRFLKDLEPQALGHFMTQGDGNHFFYVGHFNKTGRLAIVTHHGSRALGAELYKRGMAAAKKHTAINAPQVPAHNAWLDPDTQEGEEYWKALQIVRRWTRLNHFAIHDAMQQRMGNTVVDRFWNEHNFVFRRDDGLFYHAKGATPSFDGFGNDDSGFTLVPLNMAQPILVTRHTDKKDALGFAPHGAGRNLSRTKHIRRLQEEFKADSRGLSPNNVQAIFERETAGIDARSFSGKHDVSEMPSAYKNAAQVKRQIERHGLAEIVDEILPSGCIMAGELDQPWRNKKEKPRG